MEFTVRTDFGITYVFVDGNVAASFTKDDAGQAAYTAFLDGVRASKVSVYDEDSGQYLVGSVEQISALEHGGPFPIAR